MTESEKNFLRFDGCSEEKIEQIEREKDYFLLEGPEPYYFMQGYEIAERKYIEQIEKMKCCENSTTSLNGEFISCALQEEVIAKDEAIEKLELKIKDLRSNITDIIECFTSVSSKDDIELANAAREIAEILGIKLFR